MQKNDVSLTPIPDQPAKDSTESKAKHVVTDKNRVDTIARSSEPGRTGEDSLYIPPSQLHPDRSTAQSAFENPLTASSSGGYGLDHFLDKGSIAESAPTDPQAMETDEHKAEQSRRNSIMSEKLKTQVKEIAQRVSASMKGSADQIDHAIHRKPYIYALGALGAGLLLSRFFKFSTR